MLSIFIYMILFLLFLSIYRVVHSCMIRPRMERIRYIRSFRKGRFTFIFIPAFLIFMAGTSYSGRSILDSFFLSLSYTVNLVALKFEFEGVKALAEASRLYACTLYTCYALVFLNAVMFFFSLFSQRIFERISRFKAMHTGKRLIIIGVSSGNCNITASSDDAYPVFLGRLSAEERNELYMKGFPYYDDKDDGLLERIISKGRKTTVVIGTGDDSRNIDYAMRILRMIEKATDGFKDDDRLEAYSVNVFGSPSSETIFLTLEESGHGCIHYISKYRLIALDFIRSFPATRFMDSRHIDYSKAVLKDGVSINKVMVGFGKTAQQVFTSSVSSEQFISYSEGRPRYVAAKYSIIEKKDAFGDRNNIHCFQKYMRFCEHVRKSGIESQYLTLAPLPADISFHSGIDINSDECIDIIFSSLSKDEKAVNMIIIAFGSDLDNIDFAGKLSEDFRSWGLENYHILVKVRKKENTMLLFPDERIMPFGVEEDAVYSLSVIENGMYRNMARHRDYAYERAKDRGNASLHSWYEKERTKRNSSLYSCMSIISKLNMLDLELSRSIRGDGEFRRRYNPEARKNLAIAEHFRWNAFMICNGFLPPKRKEIEALEDNGTDYARHMHANITDWDSLDEFASIVSAKRGIAIEDADVKKYDYQVMDEAEAYASKLGECIVSRSGEWKTR